MQKHCLQNRFNQNILHKFFLKNFKLFFFVKIKMNIK